MLLRTEWGEYIREEPVFSGKTTTDTIAALVLVAALYFLFLDVNVVGFTLTALLFTFLFNPHKPAMPKTRYDIRYEDMPI